MIVSIPATIQFATPLLTARGVLSKRRGFFHAIEYNGKRFISESALLPEFGTEHFEHAERIVHGESLMLATAPSTVFGLDCLRFALEQRDSDTLQVPVAKLLPTGDLHASVENARQAYLSGYETVKLKVGARDLAEDIRVVNAIALEQPELALRLDANLTWSMDNVRRFADGIKTECIEWLEDPCGGAIDEWHELSRETGLAFACDEAFSETEVLAHTGVFGFSALVVKPARLGAIGERKALIECMRESEIPIVLSSMIDSSIGIAFLAHLANEWSTLDIAHGLGTLSFLKQDSLLSGLQTVRGRLVVPPLSELVSMLRPEIAREFGWE